MRLSVFTESVTMMQKTVKNIPALWKWSHSWWFYKACHHMSQCPQCHR